MHDGLLAHLNGTVPIAQLISYTCASPAMTIQNICSENHLLHQHQNRPISVRVHVFHDFLTFFSYTNLKHIKRQIKSCLLSHTGASLKSFDGFDV